MRKAVVLLTIFVLVQICYSNDNKDKAEKIVPKKDSIFSPEQLITDGRVWDVTFEDLNKDGYTDIVVANWFKPPTIYFNNSKGEFNKIKSLPCLEVEKGIYSGHAVGIGDFNRDNVSDIFFVFNSRNNLIYSGENAGGYSEGHTLNSNKSNGLYITLGDVDNDNDIDALVTNYTQPTIFWINDGKGKFVKNDFDFGTNGYNADLGDINNDGYPDVVCSVNGNVYVWFNKGNNNYERSNQFVGYLKGFGKVKLADMDNDKDLDIVLANRSFGGSVWLNDGSGVFSEATKNLTKSSTMTLGDIDLNGQIDVIFEKTIWLNKGENKFVQQKELDIKGRIIGLWLNDIDNDGDPDLFYSTTIKENGLMLIRNTTN